MLDAIIIGGSSAGLSAALVLGRSLRQVIVLDNNKPCNRFSHASHGFLTQDGTAPSEIVAIAKQQLKQYDTVNVVEATALKVLAIKGGFRVVTDQDTFESRKVLLATGLHDELPPLENIHRFWGKSVFHCPYCDGYENHHQSIVVYGTEEASLHQVMMLSHWTDKLTFCTEGKVAIPSEMREKYLAHNIVVNETPIERLEGNDEHLTHVVFKDGTSLACHAMFIHPKTSHPTTFATNLGCALDARNSITVDILGRTSVTGVYAAGDIAQPFRSVAMAVGQGSSAAAGINYDLIVEDF